MYSHWWAEPLSWIFSVFLAAVWLSRIAVVWINRKSVADISSPEYDLPVSALPTLPRVSIIVPARNEAEHIEAALLSLLQLDYPDYEVIVIDDGSTDN